MKKDYIHANSDLVAYLAKATGWKESHCKNLLVQMRHGTLVGTRKLTRLPRRTWSKDRRGRVWFTDDGRRMVLLIASTIKEGAKR